MAKEIILKAYFFGKLSLFVSYNERHKTFTIFKDFYMGAWGAIIRVCNMFRKTNPLQSFERAPTMEKVKYVIKHHNICNSFLTLKLLGTHILKSITSDFIVNGL